MTIVKPRPIFVRASVEEKELHFLKPELKGKAAVAGYPDLKLPAELKHVSADPGIRREVPGSNRGSLGAGRERCDARNGLYRPFCSLSQKGSADGALVRGFQRMTTMRTPTTCMCRPRRASQRSAR